MRRALLKKTVSIYTRNLFLSPPHPPVFNSNRNIINTPEIVSLSSISPKIRFFASDSNESSTQNPQPNPDPEAKGIDSDIEDVSNKELKTQINKYFEKGDEEELPSIFESILKRRMKGNHEDTDDEITEKLEMEPIDGVTDREFESDFENAHETDSEIENLYDARQHVIDRMKKDEFFHMDDKKWDDMIKEAVDHGHLKDTKACEQILENMFAWENLLPAELKKKISDKYNELADMVEAGELGVEDAYQQYEDFEHEMMMESARLMEEAGPPQFDETAVPDKKKDMDDPPGEGPILRWRTRAVFSPGGDSWHPKNRKVKLGVTVKELGLSKHQFRRLRELVGKRYHSGRDELTITSERFEHREENRKDCLRTLFSLIEEAGKANKLVEDARTSYVKNRLRANDKFMEMLRAKIMGREGSNPLHA